MAKSSIMIDLDDPRSTKIAEVMSNKTSKRILGLLFDKEMSESEISEALEIPINTAGYNMKKLSESGLVEKSNKFMWSSKGKKMNYYKISNKRIVISPRKMIGGILPALLGSFLIAGGLKFLYEMNLKNMQVKQAFRTVVDSGASGGIATPSAGSAMQEAATTAVQKTTETAAGNLDSGFNFYNFLANAPNSWAWFLIGALTALLIFILWNWKNVGGEK